MFTKNNIGYKNLKVHNYNISFLVPINDKQRNPKLGFNTVKYEIYLTIN